MKQTTSDMRTITTTVYKFDELNEQQQKKAIEKQRETEMNFGYVWQDEAIESLKKFAEHFGSKLIDYAIDFQNTSYSSVKFEINYGMEKIEGDEVQEIESLLNDLGEYDKETLRGNGECKLTGYCMDEDAIDGFRKAWFNGERDLNTLLQSGFKTWLKSAQADAEYQQSDEAIKETFSCNDYEFTEDGTMF